MKITLIFIFVLLQFSGFAQFTWKETNINKIYRYDDISFINSNIGFTLRGNKVNNNDVIEVLKTTNGFDWDVISTIPSQSGARSIKFHNKSIGFIGTLSGTILRTKDGGYTWEDLRNNINDTVRGFCGLNMKDGILYGVGTWWGGPTFARSNDFGDTWKIIDLKNYVNGLIDVLFLSKDEGFISGTSKSNKAIILYTNDGGDTWTTKYHCQIPKDYRTVWKMFMLNDSTIYASIENMTPIQNPPLISLRSNDKGNTWQEFTIDTITKLRIQAIGFVDLSTGWIGGHGDGLYETNDGGITWNWKNIGKNFNRFQKINESQIFAAGDVIYRYDESPNTVDADYDEIETQYIKIDYIKKVSPNPAHKIMKVEIYTSLETFVSLNIYSLEGKLVKEVHYEHLPSGNNHFVCSIDDLSEGEYILSLITNQHQDYKRFLIIE